MIHRYFDRIIAILSYLDEIKDYFGERIGLYFAYLQHYVEALMVPAFFGLITYASTSSHVIR